MQAKIRAPHLYIREGSMSIGLGDFRVMKLKTYAYLVLISLLLLLIRDYTYSSFDH